MKCRRREIFEYCPVAFILWGDPKTNKDFKAFPEWIHDAFRKGALEIKPPKVLHVRPDGAVPADAYIVRVGERITWEPDWNFKSMYEIID